MKALILALFVAACGVDTPTAPSCAELGCPVAPSGTPDLWTRCTDTVCWCWADSGVSERCEP